MASSSADSRQTPPPSPPTPPMTSQEGSTKPRGQAAGDGKRRKETKRNLEIFDKVYNKKGKVLVFPDFVKYKVTLYKRVTPARPPPPADAVREAQASREQRTPSTSTESSEGQISNVAPDSQQPEEQTEATGSGENLAGTSQDKEAAAESQKLSSEGNVEASSGGKDSDGGETKTKKIRRKDPPSFVLDKEKLKDPKILEHLESENCEFRVVERIKAALEEIADPEESPVFLLHNQNLSSKAASSKSGEKDVLVLHPHLGVLLLEVKAVEKKDAFSRFNEATAQLLHAKESIQKEMGDLLEKDAVVLAIALPKLEPGDSSIIRQKAQERLYTKPGSDVTAATSTPTMTSPAASKGGEKKTRTSGDGGKVDRIQKIKEGALLGNHPEIHLVCGSTAEVITQWVRRLQHLRATASHAFKGSTVEERVESFKEACIRRCSVAGLRPGHSVKASADLHHRFLLTEEQLYVRDSQAELLHISGPFGSGKTLLLAERARRWLREGRRLALAVERSYTMLLSHLSESVCGEKMDVARVSTHSSYSDLLAWLYTVSTEDPVSIIMDEALFKFDSFSYSSLLDHVTAGCVHGLWTAGTTPLSDEDKRKLQSLGGSTVQLSLCMRCPAHVMAWTNSVRGTNDPPLLPPPVPITRELGVGVEVISHPDHQHTKPWRICPRCREEVRAFFSSLGLHGQHAKSALSLSDVVVLTISSSCDREEVAAWLCGLGVRAVAERKTGMYDTPVLPPGVVPTSPDLAEEEAVRQRVLKGKDVTGSPAVQVLWCYDFLGLERKVVLLWHEDRQDEDRDRLTQERRRKTRMSRHRYTWFLGASRCQGRLAVMAVTHCPDLSLLPATCPPKSSAATASSNSPVTSTSHHSPVSSSSLGGESNPPTSMPPEWEIIYHGCQTGPEIEPPTFRST